jgi:hypothetical protein
MEYFEFESKISWKSWCCVLAAGYLTLLTLKILLGLASVPLSRPDNNFQSSDLEHKQLDTVQEGPCSAYHELSWNKR